MPSHTSVSVDKLARLIGRPDSPDLIDVRDDDDFAADPRLLPAARRRPSRLAADWAPAYRGRSVVVSCQHGGKLSEGVAAWLRHAGAAAEILEGGHAAWAAAGLPLVPEAELPARDGQGRTVWVTRARPKIDRIACPWLIRRFVDPDAVFLFVAPAEVAAVAERFGATPFDIEGEAVFWSHRGERCTFDVMVEEFGLAALPALTHLARIVRGADTARPDLAPEAAGLLAASLGLSRMYAQRSRAARRRDAALRRLLPLVPGRHRRDPQLAGRPAEERAGLTAPVLAGPGVAFAGGGGGLGAGRGPELRRARRADRGDAPDRGRGEALGRRPAVPARAQLLHAAAGAGSAPAGDLPRLAAATGCAAAWWRACSSCCRGSWRSWP